MDPSQTPPASGVMVISVPPRGAPDDRMLIRITTAFDDAEPSASVVLGDDEAIAELTDFLARLRGRHPLG